MVEFTGERVVPGEVDADLWNEHVARYAFAARLAGRKRVLDAGCGTGYGAAELARTAGLVVGLDNSPEALSYAREHYRPANLRLTQASCAAMPFAEGSFDLVVAFEVIEHLRDWPNFLAEIRRILAASGQAIISTPNTLYYGAARGATGPNPYHEHEFAFEEFSRELRSVFPHVSFFLQNHVHGFVVQPVNTVSAAEARIESGAGGADEAHFFIAVCAMAPQTGAPTFVYLPKSGNVLRERELHIEKLNEEITEKNGWIARQAEDHLKLLDKFRQQEIALEESNRWAVQLTEQFEQELETQRQGYEAKVAALEAENRSRAEWTLDTERRLEIELEDKRKCLEALHQAEKTVEERTNWALDLQKEIDELQVLLSRFRASRWVKLGKAIRVGPEVPNG